MKQFWWNIIFFWHNSMMIPSIGALVKHYEHMHFLLAERIFVMYFLKIFIHPKNTIKANLLMWLAMF